MVCFLTVQLIAKVCLPPPHTHHTQSITALLIHQASDMLLARLFEGSSNFAPAPDFPLKPYSIFHVCSNNLMMNVADILLANVDESLRCAANATGAMMKISYNMLEKWSGCPPQGINPGWGTEIKESRDDNLTLYACTTWIKIFHSWKLLAESCCDISAAAFLILNLQPSLSPHLPYPSQKHLVHTSSYKNRNTRKYTQTHNNVTHHPPRSLRHTLSISTCSVRHSCAALTQSEASRKGLNAASTTLPLRSEHKRAIVTALSASNSWTTWPLSWSPTLWRWQDQLWPKSCVIHGQHLITCRMKSADRPKWGAGTRRHFCDCTGWH